MGLEELKDKRVSFRVYLLTVLLVFLITIPTSQYIYGSGTTIVIGPESFTKTASYIIFKQGSTIYALNGRTGQIAFSGTNDSLIIQTTIDALPAKGGKILFLAGEYLITSKITIAKRYVVLEGEFRGLGQGPNALNEGDGVVKFKASGSVMILIHVHNSTEKLGGVAIKNIYFYGTGTTDGRIGILVDNTDQMLIQDCNFQNIQTGIYFGQNAMADAPNVVNSAFLGCGTGIYIKRACYAVIDGNSFADNADVGLSVSASTGYAYGLIITNNNFVRSTNDGIYLHGISESIVSQNTFKLNGRHGINGDLVNETVISNNVVRDNDGHGIYLKVGSKNVISNNVLMHNDRGDTASYDGLFLDTGADDNSVNGNIGFSNDRYQINVAGDYNVIMGNRLDDTGAIGNLNVTGTGNLYVNLNLLT